MSVKDYRSKDIQELDSMVVDLRKEQFVLRMQQASGMANVSEFKRVRKEIARIKTVINEMKKGKA